MAVVQSKECASSSKNMPPAPEKTFHHYLELPSNLRGMIIDEVEPHERCRFTRCSKLCRKEAEASKNYIHGLELRSWYPDQIDICVKFKNCSLPAGENDNGCIFGIEKRDDKIFMRCVVKILEVCSENEYETDDTVLMFAIKHFKSLITRYQNSIKDLTIIGNTFYDEFIDFEIENLRNLKKLFLYSDILPLMSRIPQPLESLTYEEKGQSDYKSEQLALCQQTYQVKKELNVGQLKLKYKQFLRLSANTISINVGYLTIKNIRDFIKSWQKGRSHQNLIKFTWNCEWNNLLFTAQLFKLLGGKLEGDQIKTMTFQHRNEPNKYGMLTVKKDCFEFEAMTGYVPNQEPVQQGRIRNILNRLRNLLRRN